MIEKVHPASNPNAYVAGLVGATVDIVLYELHKRAGISLDAAETSFVATAIPFVSLLIGRKLGQQPSPPVQP